MPETIIEQPAAGASITRPVCVSARDGAREQPRRQP